MMIIQAKRGGLTLIETLIGVFLTLVVFLGILGGYELALKTILQSRNRVIAAGIASGEIERLRNLSYESVGIVGGFPEGILQQETVKTANGIQYTVALSIDYVVDEQDGLALPQDECPNDYKKTEVKVSWSKPYQGEVSMGTDVAPENLAQECAESGGILGVSVFDAFGIMVPSPLIEIKDPTTETLVRSASPDSGFYYFFLPVGQYQVLVSKENYNSERTYSIEEVATPANPHPLVLEDEFTSVSFPIDHLASLDVQTLSPWVAYDFSDSFVNESKIAQLENSIVSEGKVTLSNSEGQYQNAGHIISQTIALENFIRLNQLVWDDQEPAGTTILYHLLYWNGADWLLIPDADLPNNETGLTSSPVVLSAVPPSYDTLRLKAGFATTDVAQTPELFEWSLSWLSEGGTPIGGIVFSLQGSKIIGKDGSENEVYELSQDYTSNEAGSLLIGDLEWDDYTFSMPPSSLLSLESIQPNPQPINLGPNETVNVQLFLESQNYLVVTVKDEATSSPIFAAQVRLHAGSFDVTRYTNQNGQTTFIPLGSGTYALDIEGPGYDSSSQSVYVSGHVFKVVQLEETE